MCEYVLTKLFSREHSLFYCELWSHSETHPSSVTIDGKLNNLLYLLKPGDPQASSWYDQDDIFRLFPSVIEKS